MLRKSISKFGTEKLILEEKETHVIRQAFPLNLDDLNDDQIQEIFKRMKKGKKIQNGHTLNYVGSILEGGILNVIFERQEVTLENIIKHRFPQGIKDNKMLF